MSNYCIDNYLIKESSTLHQWSEYQFCEAQDNDNLKLKIQAIVITQKNYLIKNLEAFQQLQQINHPNIMKIYYIKEVQNEKQIIITEQCSTKLNKHFQFESNRNNFTKAHALRFIHQISSGFVKLHENNISLSNFSYDTILIKRDNDNQITYKLFGHFIILDESLIKIGDRRYCYEFGQILKSLFSILKCGDKDINDIINQLTIQKDISWKKLQEQVHNLLMLTSNKDLMEKIEVYKPQDFRYFSQNNFHKSQSMIIPRHQQQTQIPQNQFRQSTNTNKNCQTIQPDFYASQSSQIMDTQVNNQRLNHTKNQSCDFQLSQVERSAQFDFLPIVCPSGKINVPGCKYTNWMRVPPNSYKEIQRLVDEYAKSQTIYNFSEEQESNLTAPSF